ncbi:MAG: FAD-dependent oxidoreductase [Anaerolineae bacterium]
MGEMTLTINDIKVVVPEGTTILDAATSADVYVPTLCSHPSLSTSKGLQPNEFAYRGDDKILSENRQEYDGCRLCIVEVQGMDGFQASCNAMAEDGMAVRTDSPEIHQQRRKNLFPYLEHHPHACLTCAQKQGCSRTQCSANVPEEERCCPQLGNCELEKLVDYVGLPEALPKYVPRGIPVLDREPLLIRDYNLCVGCTRCVRACQELRAIEAIGFVYRDGELVIGSADGPTLLESACKFCTACVEVCPTGALTDKAEVTAANKQEVLVPCVAACPANVDVPRYIRLIADGKYPEAEAVIREKVPFPAVLGRICFRPCEEVCRRGELNEPMAICSLKRFAADEDTDLWKENLQVAPPTGKQVAIVGSGPAGLTAAYYLTVLGHAVTVFEAESEPGGMLRWGVPAHRLPEEVLEKEIDDLRSLGAELETDTTIGQDQSLEDLQKGYDAIFLAGGTQLARRIPVEGADLEGVLWGMDFLRQIRRGEDVKVKGRVLVIGGGGVAMDVALTALRLGAQEVQVASLECREEMPAMEWEIEEAVEEGVSLIPSWGPQRIVGDNGKVKAVDLVCCTRVFDEQGRFDPTFDESETTSTDTDMVILAVGQAPDLSLLEGSGIEADGGFIKADENTLETNVKGVFAGGEVVSGPSSVIEAIQMGRQTAISIDKHLGGDGDIEQALVPPEESDPFMGREDGFAERARLPMPSLTLDERHASFAEVCLGYDEEMAQQEASRCLRCDYRLHIEGPISPPEKWLQFSSEIVEAAPELAGVYQLLDAEKNVLAIKGVMNMREALEEELEANEEACFFIFEEDEMYTKRESELLQQYLQQYGELPGGGMDELDDLF